MKISDSKSEFYKICGHLSAHYPLLRGIDENVQKLWQNTIFSNADINIFRQAIYRLCDDGNDITSKTNIVRLIKSYIYDILKEKKEKKDRQNILDIPKGDKGWRYGRAAIKIIKNMSGKTDLTRCLKELEEIGVKSPT